ncbi:MAG TPA: hypothetical protein VMI75_13925 [Polyangiaceae bacterium]|nr:hypothetical protein [Polyangiaceae bacterium]
MRTRVDARLREEATRYALRFACEDCAHFVPASERCSLEYPASPRRDALLAHELELCKEFELGDSTG